MSDSALHEVMSGENDRTGGRLPTAEAIDLPTPRNTDLPVVREDDLPEHTDEEPPEPVDAEGDGEEPGRLAGVLLAASVAFFLTSAVWYVVTTTAASIRGFGLAFSVPPELSAGFLLATFGLCLLLTYWIPLFVLAILVCTAGVFGLTATLIVLVFGAGAMPTGFVILLGTSLAPAALLALGLKLGAVRP
ncbi:hypothetical protein [Natronorarus salvus]|uniref:hypothetical protein n=1 Tax=Natronorarus salvus TaxID=3117733 RepID=UPI002F263DC7